MTSNNHHKRNLCIRNNRIQCGIFLLILFFLVSCKKFVEIPPPQTQLVSSSVFTSDATATSAIAGIYSNMMGTVGTISGPQSITSLSGMSADEFFNYNNIPDATQFEQNSLVASNGYVLVLWQQLYQYIYQANAALEGLSSSSGITLSTKQQLQGEAVFIRSFCLFYLTNYFGDIPLVITTDYQLNSVAGRNPQADVYKQIISDLINAQNLLSDTYVSSERTRPNKSTATALLARVYLYTNDFNNAIIQSTAIINDAQYSLTGLNSTFLKNSTESIWQLQPVLPGYNTFDGYTYILTSAPTNFSLTNELIDSFEEGDQRKIVWTDSVIINNSTFYYPFKYKIQADPDVSEYLTVFRLAEQYLIRSESQANGAGAGVAGAVRDLNVIRNRAGLPNYSGLTDNASIIQAIIHERQVELFCEWGHRWFDLKRTNMANSVLSKYKGNNWQSTDQLYPIPQSDIINDPNLKQNPGYN